MATVPASAGAATSEPSPVTPAAEPPETPLPVPTATPGSNAANTATPANFQDQEATSEPTPAPSPPCEPADTLPLGTSVAPPVGSTSSLWMAADGPICNRHFVSDHPPTWPNISPPLTPAGVPWPTGPERFPLSALPAPWPGATGRISVGPPAPPSPGRTGWVCRRAGIPTCA